jgi:tripartite-type tricarboxylate transporter receptor subunit TctC
MRKDTKHMAGFMAVLLALLVSGRLAAQTQYPNKPIRMIVGAAPGNPSDIIARLLGQRFTEAMGQTVVIDNTPGAAGNIAAERLAKATPDGYTLGTLALGPIVINPGLYKLAYDPVSDIAPVSQLAVQSNVLVVHNAVPARTVRELVALATAQPCVLTFASGGSGTAVHMAAELFKSAAGLDILHIPYKSAGLALPDLLGGRVTMIFLPISMALPLARDAKLRALAVTSARRSPAAPEFPTIAESGYPSFEFTAWIGLFAPARTPTMIVRKLHLETARTLGLPSAQAKFSELGMEGIGNSPAAFSAIIKSEIPKWAKVIKDAGIKPE